MNCMPHQMKHGTYRLYRRNAEGELIFVKDVNYTYCDKNVSPCDAERDLELAWRDAAELERRAADAEAFEALADAACEQEG